MAQLVVRNIENGVKTGLQRRAKKNGRSMEAEVREILRNAVTQPEPAGGLGSQIAAMLPKPDLDFEIQELRGFTIEPPAFDE